MPHLLYDVIELKKSTLKIGDTEKIGSFVSDLNEYFCLELQMMDFVLFSAAIEKHLTHSRRNV